MVIDSEDVGWGCSSRNGGQISTSIKPTFQQLKKKYNSGIALDILKEGHEALTWVEKTILDNNIHCDFRRVGRFNGAHSKAAFDSMCKNIEQIPAELGVEPEVIERNVQHREIATDFYHGGIVFPHHASLDPARYHRGLLDCAKSNGTEIISHCNAENIESNKTGFSLTTSKGIINAKKIIIATSGYTGKLTTWHQRRIIPIGSYIIATEPLPDNLAKKLIPNERVISDTLKLVVYYRTCPERQSLIFGGRVSLKETDCYASAPQLRKLMLKRFPELASAKISHSWMGFVGYTFDQMPHLGEREGVYYSMGYCGSGISLSSYLGMKVGLKAVGNPDGATALDQINFPGRFYHRGNPWFLGPSISFYRMMDRN